MHNEVISTIIEDNELLEIKARLLGSLLLFTRFFYKLRTGKDFIISQPVGRESHYITIARNLTNIFYGHQKNTFINIAPRYGKTEMMIHFMAWTFAHNPACNYIYTSFSEDVAVRSTSILRDILNMPAFKRLFGLEIRSDTNSKPYFCTTAGGEVFGLGAGGAITSKGGGVLGSEKYAGALIFDDILKPKDIHSETIREERKLWFDETFLSRRNSPMVTPVIGIGQKLGEGDQFDELINNPDWTPIIIKTLDDAGNVLDPARHTREALMEIERRQPIVYWTQYQQMNLAPGGSIFKEHDFVLLDEEPDIMATFLTIDTAETSKSYNDATVFSFWGLYRIKQGNILTDEYGLHWLDCAELRVEPKDLQAELMQFYAGCMRHTVKPKLIAIEKKSTGVTLLSILKTMQGIQVIDIDRNCTSGNKKDRFISIQYFVCGRHISFTRFAKHTERCINHCKKITTNNTHLHDDIADTLYDAVKIALIDKLPIYSLKPASQDELKAKKIMGQFNALQRIRTSNGNHARL